MTRTATHTDIGHLVRFYSNGWRFGRLLEIEKRAAKWTAVIQSPPIKGKRSTRVPLEDVEAAEDHETDAALPPPAAVAICDKNNMFATDRPDIFGMDTDARKDVCFQVDNTSEIAKIDELLKM